MIEVSLCIPTYNAGDEWLATLESINLQSCKLKRKVIVDSGSSDNTVLHAEKAGFEIIKIDKSEFNHGATRQLLVEACTDVDICVFITQDAILSTSASIQNLVDIFEKDVEIGMAYGRQLPHKNAKTLETHARLFNYPEKSIIRSYHDKEKLGFKVFFCSNSFSAYRRKTLLDMGGFPSNSIMGEDALVAAKMLMQGFKIAYVAESSVYHSHSYTLKEEFKRYFDTRVFHEQNNWLIQNYGKPTGEGIKFLKSELNYVLSHNILSLFKSISSIFAKWSGYKIGKFYKKMPLPILKKLSMHKHYWK